MDNISQSGNGEYDFIHSIWEKIKKESDKRKKQKEKQNKFNDSDKRFINERMI